MDVGSGVGGCSDITGIALFIGLDQLTEAWPFGASSAKLGVMANAASVVFAFARGNGKEVLSSKCDERVHAARRFNADNCVKNEKKMVKIALEFGAAKKVGKQGYK